MNVPGFDKYIVIELVAKPSKNTEVESLDVVCVERVINCFQIIKTAFL